MGFRYTVKATFQDQALAEEWLTWLQRGHGKEVCEGGALVGGAHRDGGRSPAL